MKPVNVSKDYEDCSMFGVMALYYKDQALYAHNNVELERILMQNRSLVIEDVYERCQDDKSST